MISHPYSFPTYIVKWIREDDVEGQEGQHAISTYELQSVRVCQSSLYAEAHLPAFAVGELYESFALKGALVKYQSQREVIKVML